MVAGLFLILQAALGGPGLQAQGGWDLQKCHEAALRASETLAVSREAVRQAEFQYRQVLGSSLPELSFRYQYLWQDQSGVGSEGSFGSSFTQSPQPEGAFRLRQNPFSGYREIAALKSASSLVEGRRLELRRTEHTLLQEVATAFYDVLEAEKGAETTGLLLSLTRVRLMELVERERVGRSRQAEVLTVEAQLASLEADLEEAQSEASSARDALSRLVGGDIAGPLQEDSALPDPPGPLEEHLGRVEERPDVSALREGVVQAQGAVHVSRSKHFPQATLSGNYYTKRSGFREPIDWDVVGAVELPLWSWGAVRSSVQTAQSQKRQAAWELSDARRLAAQEIRRLHREFSSSLKRYVLLVKSLEVAQRNYAVHEREYRLGLVTNLEVLEAMNRLHQARLASHTTLFKAKLDGLKLQIAVGRNGVSP